LSDGGSWGNKENIAGQTACVHPDNNRKFPASMPDTLALEFANCAEPASLELKGILDLTVPSGGNDGKAIHLVANADIADLSTYGIGVANNGGGTDGQEYTFPNQAVAAGDHILVARDTSAMGSYLCDGDCSTKFQHVLETDSHISQNGDDAIELFENGSVIETFGDPTTDGTGQDWEYKDSWAYKVVNNTWTYGEVDCTDGSETSATSRCPYTVPPQ